MFRTALCLALHFASGSPALPAAARDAEPLVIDVDAGAPATPLTFEYGADGPSGARCDTGVDLSQELASMGSSLVRTHDSGVLDWTAVYPHPLAPLDARYPTDDPASYRAAWKKRCQSGSRGAAAGVPHGSSEWGSHRRRGVPRGSSEWAAGQPRRRRDPESRPGTTSPRATRTFRASLEPASNLTCALARVGA